MNAIDFENAAVAAKEDRLALFRRECMLASVAVDANAAAWLAHLWGAGVSTQLINRLARIWTIFPIPDIAPDATIALYGAALDTDDSVVWLRRALAEQWSPRQLRDAAGLSKGRKLSSTIFQGHDVEVTGWDVPTGTFSAVGLPLSGEMPERAQVTVREILCK